MNFLTIFVLTLLSLISRAPQTQAARILAIFPCPGRSQYIFGETYLKALAARGHEVTVINTFKNRPVENIRFIEVPKIFEYYEDLLKQMNMPTYWGQQKVFSYMFNLVSECILDNEGVQSLMKSGETFDLMLVELLQTEALYGLAQHFNASLIGFSSYGNDFQIDKLMGNVSPLSYNPLILSPRSNVMTFFERLQNHYETWLEKAVYWLIHHPSMERQYAKYFPHAKQTLTEVLDSFTLMLLGQHFSLSYARPYLPNMIEVGGIHIAHKPKPLPEDIKKFIESSPEGVIYFSLGTNMKSKDLPAETREALLKVFRGLKQRVLWKFEDDQLPGKPDNVLISKWFPQPDILAHPNVKLFITHGGLLSTIESVYFGKPVLGLPIFYDQFLNVNRATRMGFGLGLNLQKLTQLELEQTIKTLLTVPSYAQTSQTISERYRDQPESSLERAIWWTEYVIRHKGAPHMRAASRDLNYAQLHSLDTLAVLVGVPLICLFIVTGLVCWLIRLVFGGKKKRADKKKRH